MCQHHVSKIRRDVANDGNRKAIDVRKRWCLSKHVALRPVGWLTRQAGVRSWTPVAGAALGVSSRPVSVGGGGTAPSLCRLRAPRGCDPCNQANVVWCASALSRPLGALAARDPSIQAVGAGAEDPLFWGRRFVLVQSPPGSGPSRGPAGVGNPLPRRRTGQTVSARTPRGGQSFNPFRPLVRVSIPLSARSSIFDP